ncbi:hypothetical protein TOPH_08420 [Tolypocladium ophioglossoides CBS 100239]|uniref:Large ribosomal subunit protein mL50 n=1 Tax=Tolypocladium ophioglossoides (strain CBS 100239) TaxID=1163406 RepID=A0A0L0MYG8_TOLOC|nr:hypothetical protein TOPH_08420 [Tolypocladium ophioglossoides CBS 100239]
MPRIPRVRGLQSLQLAIAPTAPSTRTPFVASRAVSTTCAARSKNTEWVRGKLWKGEAPGPEDPYTQRPELEDPSNLPEEALEPRPRYGSAPAPVQASRLPLPPKRTEATAEKELKSADPTYVPAIDVEGLEEITAIKSWWEQPGHWGEESEFRGFGSPDKAVEKAVVEVYLRRAVVEVLALQEAGAFAQWATKKWRRGDRSDLDQALAVEILVQDGTASLEGDASSVSQSLTAEAEEAGEAHEQPIPLDEAKEMTKTWDSSWKDLVLDDQVKFALRKRLYQLTGNLIPDAKLGAARTVKHILTLASKQPKPPKLAQLLSRRSDLQQLPNIKLHSRKIGPIDKEVAVGRWKVIEEELKKRDLPVTGTGGLSKNKERDWLSGKI